MAFGEPRLDTIDDVSALLSSIRERIEIVAARQRMNLTKRDVAELEGAFDDCDRIQDLFLDLRDTISEDYARKIGRRVSKREAERQRQAEFLDAPDLYQQLL